MSSRFVLAIPALIGASTVIAIATADSGVVTMSYSLAQPVSYTHLTLPTIYSV